MANKNSASTTTPLMPDEVIPGKAMLEPQLRVIEDPLAEYFQENWKSYVYTFVVVIAVYYGYTVFRDVARSARESGGDYLSTTQRQFEALANTVTSNPQTEEAKKASQELKSKVEQSIHALSFAKDPFPEIGNYYEGLLKRLDNSPAALASAKEVVAQARFLQNPASGRARLLAELDFFASARQLLDTDKQLAQKALEQLVEQGAYLHAAAAITISTIASTPEEQKHAEELRQRVITLHPEQDEVLRDVD